MKDKLAIEAAVAGIDNHRLVLLGTLDHHLHHNGRTAAADHSVAAFVVAAADFRSDGFLVPVSRRLLRQQAVPEEDHRVAVVGWMPAGEEVLHQVVVEVPLPRPAFWVP